MRDTVKKVVGSVQAQSWERVLAWSILRGRFRSLLDARVFEGREALWQHCIERVGVDRPLTYVEFGVHEGYSIKQIARMNKHPDSAFVGLDSFEGLPEQWGDAPAGTFDVKGRMPQSDDARLRFIAGWFQDTADELMALLRARECPLVVHYDADLYSSTLFALTQIATLKVPYLAIFDEFPGHETRALYNFEQAYGVAIEFLGKAMLKHDVPMHVLCRITPRT